MNGAIADPPANTTKNPINNKINMTGISHHIFLSLIKYIISDKKLIVIIY